jgi:DnaJ-class molecular chaperone
MVFRTLLLLALILLCVRIVRRLLAPSSNAPSQVLDPYEVLEVSQNASPDELKAAYYKKLAQYHPDKVAHLGDELKKLAQVKTKDIIAAYEVVTQTRPR